MKHLLIMLMAFVFFSCSNEETFLGKEPIFKGDVLTVKQLLDKKLMNSTVQIKGKVYNVCKAEGCWFIMKQDQTTLRCSFESPSIFMDTLNLNKIMTLEGKLIEQIIDEETAKDFAEQAGENAPIMEGSKKRVPIFVVSTILLNQ